jgi:nucleoside-diphosphate-sugar epimerase
VILIAGGTGTRGTRLAERLRARQLPVRVLTRHPGHAQRLVGEHAEVADGEGPNRGASSDYFRSCLAITTRWIWFVPS